MENDMNNEMFNGVTGALFSPVDVRDYRLACVSNESEFPDEFELHMPKIKNQKSISSCVAHSIASTIEYFNIFLIIAVCQRCGKAFNINNKGLRLIL